MELIVWHCGGLGFLVLVGVIVTGAVVVVVVVVVIVEEVVVVVGLSSL